MKERRDIQAIQEEVRARVEAEREKYESKGSKRSHKKEDQESSYFLQNGYLCRSKATKDGNISIRLCNFTATITEENLVDNGAETEILFTIEGCLSGKHPLPRLEIPAANFPGLGWLSKWGARCIIEPGQTVKDFVRHAIQNASGDVKSMAHYAHTGWRKINGEWVYLHTGGAIGAENVSVRLSKELSRFCLPLPPPIRSTAAKEALQAALDFLHIGHRSVTLPLFSLIYLTPLTTMLSPMPNFSAYLYGASGSFKTTLALLALSHFGNFGGVDGLSNFDDSVGALEKRAFTLKDTLHLVDDYHPSHQKHNAQARENVLQRLIRGYSNRTARGRLNSDLTEKGRYEPRGMLLITAEELPAIESTLARIAVIEIADGSVDKARLTNLQERAHLLPLAMADYLNWLRENLADIQIAFPERFIELRRQVGAEGSHRKLSEQTAFLTFGLEVARSFFKCRGMLSEEEGEALVMEGRRQFLALASLQQRRIADDDPVQLFWDVLVTLLHQHKVRLEALTSEATDIGAEEKIGFFDTAFLHLLPTAVWHAVQKYCIHEGYHFPFSRPTFIRMLRDKGMIIPSSSGETTTFVRHQGKSFRVLKVVDSALYRRCIGLDASETT